MVRGFRSSHYRRARTKLRPRVALAGDVGLREKSSQFSHLHQAANLTTAGGLTKPSSRRARIAAREIRLQYYKFGLNLFAAKNISAIGSRTGIALAMGARRSPSQRRRIRHGNGVVRYWKKLNEGYDRVFDSRFMRGGGVIDYPKTKSLLNPLANYFVKVIFRVSLNDMTNAFKAYRKEVIVGYRPLIAPQFNFTIQIPLKAIVRGYPWAAIPIPPAQPQDGNSHVENQGNGKSLSFYCFYVWLEKYFSRGDS